MPIYEYRCQNCEHEFEKYQSFSEDSLTLCPECQKHALRKVYSPALVVFKGKGFYVTDHKSSSSTLTSNTHKDSSNGSSEGSSESGSEDSSKKTEKKAEKKDTKTEKKASK